MWIFLLIWIHAVCAYEIKTLSESPRIYWISDLLTSEQCDSIMKQAAPHLQRSTVLGNTTKGDLDPRRTSFGMFFPSNPTNPALKFLEQKASELTELPIVNGEGIQVLRYGVGGEYQPHYDYFLPSHPGGAQTLRRGGQRVATLIVYLNQPEAGGETIFPLAKISVTPQKGSAVLFYNVTPKGKEDPNSFHGGAPVIQGEKWIATKWIREREFH
jgi:prolyl 4-hydroxylase